MPDVGRPFSPFLGIDYLLRLRGDQLTFYREMREREGDTVCLRLGPRRLWLMFHPDQIHALLTEKSSSFIRYKRMMDILAQWNGQSLIVREGQPWRETRRKIMPAFARHRMPEYAHRVVTRARSMAEDWIDQSKDGTVTLDTDREMAVLALRIAMDTLFGGVDAGDDETLGRAVAGLSDTAFRETTNPVPIPDWLPLASKRRKLWAMRTVWDAVDRIIEARLNGPDRDHGDLLSMLIGHTGREPRMLRNEIVSLMIAAHETSGAGLSWTAYLLGQHGAVLDAVQAEIAAAVPDHRAFTLEDLERLPLLRRVIDESMRLYPPAYALFTREAAESCDLAGVPIRRGDLVQVVPFITHRDPRWFEAPELFRPQRFEHQDQWPRCAYLPFGTGPRVCIGQAFGAMELALALATLLRRFTPLPVAGPVVPAAKFSLRPAGGLIQTWRLRG